MIVKKSSDKTRKIIKISRVASNILKAEKPISIGSIV